MEEEAAAAVVGGGAAAVDIRLEFLITVRLWGM
jgi:hypothetical protein